MNKSNNETGQGGKKLWVLWVLIILGLLGTIYVYSRFGIGYALLFALIYAGISLYKFFKNK